MSYGRCKVCDSIHRHKIEEWMAYDGLTLVECEKRIKEELGESIGRTTIWRHMKEHFADRKEIKEAYKEKIDIAQEKSKLLKECYVEDNLSEIDKLDNMISKDYALYMKSAELMKEKMQQKLTPNPLVNCLKTLNNNIINSMKTKAELLGTDAAGRQASVLETWVDLVDSLDD